MTGDKCIDPFPRSAVDRHALAQNGRPDTRVLLTGAVPACIYAAGVVAGGCAGAGASFSKTGGSAIPRRQAPSAPASARSAAGSSRGGRQSCQAGSAAAREAFSTSESCRYPRTTFSGDGVSSEVHRMYLPSSRSSSWTLRSSTTRRPRASWMSQRPNVAWVRSAQCGFECVVPVAACKAASRPRSSPSLASRCARSRSASATSRYHRRASPSPTTTSLTSTSVTTCSPRERPSPVPAPRPPCRRAASPRRRCARRRAAVPAGFPPRRSRDGRGVLPLPGGAAPGRSVYWSA